MREIILEVTRWLRGGDGVRWEVMKGNTGSKEGEITDGVMEV